MYLDAEAQMRTFEDDSGRKQSRLNLIQREWLLELCSHLSKRHCLRWPTDHGHPQQGATLLTRLQETSKSLANPHVLRPLLPKSQTVALEPPEQGANVTTVD